MKKKQSQMDFDDYMIQTSSLYKQLNEKYELLAQNVYNIFSSILDFSKDLKDLDTVKNQKDYDYFDYEEFQDDPKLMVKNIKDIMQKLFNITGDIAKSLKQRENVIYESYDKTQLKLEAEVRQNKLNQQKLAINNECLNLRLKNLSEKHQTLEQQYLQYKDQVQQLQNQLETSNIQKNQYLAQLKKEKDEAFSQLRRIESEDIIQKRALKSSQSKSRNLLQKNDKDQHLQTLNNQKIKNQNFFTTTNIVQNKNKINPSLSNSNLLQNSQIYPDQRKNSNLLMRQSNNQEKPDNSVLSSNPIQFPYTIQSEQFNKLVGCFSNQTGLNPNKDGRKYQNQVFQANRQKDIQQQKFHYDLKRLNIQLQAKSEENQKLQRQVDEFQQELKTLKQQIYEEQKKKWSQEAISDKNPNLIDYYKQQLEQKHKKIKEAQKSQRKFAIQEKKLMVKEKAFENERVDYHSLTLKQAQRIEVLMKIKGFTKEQLEFMVKLDDIERRGLNIRQVEMVADYLHRKQISARDFQTMMEDDFKQRVDLLKQQQKLQQNKIYFDQNVSEYH